MVWGFGAKKLKAIDWHIVNEKKYGTKSIAVLLGHMIRWRIFVIKKLKGDEVFAIQIDGPSDWPEIRIGTAKEWDDLLGELKETQNTLLRILSLQTDELLERKVPGENFSFRFLLEGIIQHDLYHLGQIALLNSQYKR
ncbi:MAG: DinB family protein [Maribacter sp.]|nr:DinB family protein [Maribacter sp.]